MHDERFTGRVWEYARYRARYPKALLPWLRTQCGLQPTWCVADIGAGTGMLAEVFLASGHAVMAVEPNAEMRVECERMCARYPRLRVVDGAAEQTGVATASVDMVSVGRALHWFDMACAEVEFRRVLKPSGWVVVVSSGREHGRKTAQGRAFEDLLLRHGTDTEHVRRWALRAQRTDLFLRAVSDGAEPIRETFVTERRLSWDEFVGETQSLSVTPIEGMAGFDAMRQAMRAFFATWSEGEVLRAESVCAVSAARVQAADSV